MAPKFPFIFQHDSKDCGPTCLQMVHRWFGGEIPISVMRELCDLNTDGVSMQGMALAAEHLKMEAFATYVTAEKIDDLPLPFIAHWLQEHFVVVIGVTAEKIRVADPAHGVTTYSRKEFLRHWLGRKNFGQVEITDNSLTKPGAVLLLSTKADFLAAQYSTQVQPKPSWQPLQSLPGVLRKQRARVALISLIFPVLLLITLTLPFIMQQLIDRGLSAGNLHTLSLFLAGYLVLLLSRNVIAAVRDMALLHVGTNISLEIVHGFMQQLLQMRISFFERRSLGDLIQRQQDHQRIESFLTTQSLPAFFSLLTFSVFAFMLSSYSILILIVVLVFACLTLLWISRFYRFRRQYDLQQFELESAVQSHSVEIMSAVTDLKAYGLAEQKGKFYRSLLKRRYKTRLRALRLDEIQSIGAVLLMDTGEIIALYLAGEMVIEAGLSLGDFVAVMYILGQLRGPLARMVPFFQSAQDATLSLGRLKSLGEEPIEATESSGDKALFSIKHADIRVERLSFRYNHLHKENVLNDISFTIPAGKVTAIVGASGSGKSTLIKLLTRLHEPVEGQISYGDLPLNTTSPGVWRRRIGQVMQEGTIFDATMRYNITLSHGDPDEKLLQQALTVAGVLEFMHLLPLGVMTSIGRAGWQLSTGQKQRVLIARALYRDPEILIFDEATSALDSNNELTITDALEQVYTGRTTIVISHRLSTLRHADCVLVLENGCLVEEGTHDELILQQGAYYRTFNRQLNLFENNT